MRGSQKYVVDFETEEDSGSVTADHLWDAIRVRAAMDAAGWMTTILTVTHHSTKKAD